MERSASLVGAHVALLFERQRSLSEARIETTMLRLSGLSGDATQKALPSPSEVSVEAASESTVAGSAGSTLGLSERTDIVFADLTAVPADSLMFLELRRRF